MLSKVYILVLNWNGWQDTIECLESIFHNDYPYYTVVLCDNDSQDGSLQKIKLWADGGLDIAVAAANPHRHLSNPPFPKPIPYVEYNRETAEGGGNPKDGDAPLILIKTGRNLGFSGGNNVGMRYILRNSEVGFVWLLNNDTVILPDTLTRLVAKAESKADIGAIGSTVIYYYNPGIINAVGGGRFIKYLGSIYHPLIGKPVAELKDRDMHLDYIFGASCLAPLKIIREVGLLDEVFSPAYWEDADWGFRITKAGYKNAYERWSIVYHKSGGSGASSSALGDYLEVRNGLFFCRRHYASYFILFHVIKILFKFINRVRRRQIERIPIILKGFFDGLFTRINKF